MLWGWIFYQPWVRSPAPEQKTVCIYCFITTSWVSKDHASFVKDGSLDAVAFDSFSDLIFPENNASKYWTAKSMKETSAWFL
jgi:hypothetical protein